MCAPRGDWRFLALLLVVAGASSSASACPKPCACYVPAEVHCTFRYLSAMPRDIQPAVQRINLGYNSLTVLREDELTGLKNLELLMLHSNTIHTIEDRAFSSLKSLQVLKISYNRVNKLLKDTFQGLDNLLRLHMDHNRIEFIHPEAFYGLTSLQLLHLEGNLLQQLHPDTFVTLRLSQIFKFSTIKTIYLSENTLTTLPATVFTGCYQLENLFLHGNPFSCDCRMEWFGAWTKRNSGVLKCKRDRKVAGEELCPICESPLSSRGSNILHLSSDAYACSKPWIHPSLKQRNLTVDESNYMPVSPNDFIAPIGTIEMNITDQFHNDASIACVVQRPSGLDNLNVTQGLMGENISTLTATVSTSLICNIDYDHIRQLWSILATYSDSPLKVERELLLSRAPEMIYKYKQVRSDDDEVFTETELEIKANPAWLMQNIISLKLDRTTTTYSTLHLKYMSNVEINIENNKVKRDRYSWTMIKRDNNTKTETSVLAGGLVELNCQIYGDPKPSIEWILPDGSKVRAPYNSEDHRIIIADNGKLMLRTADTSDAGIYHCIATNYLDADVLSFRVTVLSPDVEEVDINGVKLSHSVDESLFLDCETTGSPQASVHWILPDHTIMGKSYGNKKLFQNGTLGIYSLTERDRGFYRCLAANHLGVDLLTSLLNVSSNGIKRVKLMDTEGSGDDEQLSREESKTLSNEDLSSRIMQESRTVTSDRPYPRRRPSLHRASTNRRGGGRRSGWNRRVFDKATRQVDPEKLADFIKRSQNNKQAIKGGSRVNPSENLKDNEVQNGETGSGNGVETDHSVPNQVKTITENPKNDYSNAMTTYHVTKTNQQNTPTMTEVETDNPVNVQTTTENMFTVSTSSYSYADVTPVEASITLTNYEIQKDDITPITNIQGLTVAASDSDAYSFDKALQPFTLQFTVTESMDEMELQFSGDTPETVTEVMPENSQNPNVTPVLDRLTQSLNPVIHTSVDPESQTTYTAVTTTEREQDEIMFHTTQRIKSPRLPPGSTIISHQQIHIIPPNKKKPGKRRNFFNRRRVIRPNKITDIQSILDKFKMPSVKNAIEGNATVRYAVELTTDWDGEKRVKPTVKSKTDQEQRSVTQKSITTTLSTPFVTSPKLSPKSDAPKVNVHSKSDASHENITSKESLDQKPTQDPKKQVSTTVTPATPAKSSKVIRGKIPWDRLFGSKESQKKILNRLRKPTKPSTTTQSKTSVRTMTTTAPLKVIATLPTIDAMVAPMTVSPAVVKDNQDKSETSRDYTSGSSSFTESQNSNEVTTSFTTPVPSTTALNMPVTTPAYGSTSSPASQISPILPAPPTTRTSSKEDTFESSSSGSDLGGSGEFAGRPWRNRKPGFHRRRFRGRRPIKKTTTQAPRTSSTIQTDSKMYSLTFTPTSVMMIPSVSTSSAVTESNNKKWRNPAKTTSFTKTNSVDNKPSPTHYTYDKTANTAKPYTTLPSKTHSNKIRGKNNKRRPSRRRGKYQTQRPLVTAKRPIPKAHREDPSSPDSSSRDMNRSKERTSTDKTLSFDIVTVLTAEESYKGTPGPYNGNNSNGISNTYDHTTGYGTTSSNSIGFESSTRDLTSKPRILGVNGATFNAQSESDAFLPCEATGNPRPVISWQRFTSGTGNTMTIKGKMGKFEVFSNGTLLIQNVNVKDRGQYLCLAENSQGSDKLVVTLSVLAYPSRILGPKVREVKVHSGKTVEMKCKTEGKPVPVVSWILANRTQVKSQQNERGRMTVTPEGTLVIQEVSVYDRGLYKCIASNAAGSDTATVRLHVVATPPGILEEKQQLVNAEPGQSVWMPCTARGDPQPVTHWVLFDGTLVRPQYSHSRISAFPNGTLHMKNLDFSDSGKYECIATSSTGSERRVVVLSVEKMETAPQIIETSDRRTELDYGNQLQLTCTATGNPKPQIIWRLPSKALVDQWHRMGSRIQVLDNGTLIVDSVSEKDDGDYLCVARNKMGDDLHLMKVSVSMKPAKIEPKVISKKQVPYGKDLKVDCKASGAPIPEISWGLPDGTLVNSALQADSSRGTRSKRYILFDNGTLFLNKVGMDEEGDYTCYAENTVGKDEMHVHITVVTAAPRIRPPNLTYAKVKPGGKIRFDCEAVGEPKPKILWMLPSNDVIAASNERYLMHVNGSLDIRDIKLADAGEYVCMARNAAGEESRVYKLDINGNPPVINGYYQNRTVVKDTATKYTRKLIDCKAEGSPTPKITWIMPDNIFLTAPYFGSRIIVHYNGTLEIRNVRPTDTAEFICMAQNDGGEAVMVVHLEVTNQLRRPIFKNPFNERLVTRLGKTTVLNCSADGQPPPDIIWTFPNGTQISGGPNKGPRHHFGNDGTFVIYNPSKEDAGKYRCAAKNKVGYIEKVIVLEVGQKPYILTRPRGIIRSMSGEPLYLHCLADGSPRPNIFWTLPSGHTLSRPQSTGNYRLMENGTLVIHHAKLHDRGNYVCRARNDAGEAVLTVPVVIVAYPPRITSGPPPSLKAMASAPVQLNCIAVGIPKPEIIWELPDRSVISTAGKGRPTGSELLHPQGTLVIQKPTRTDSGIYKCQATNYLGTDTRTTYVRVI